MKKQFFILLTVTSLLLTGCDESNPAGKELHDFLTPESLAKTFSGTFSEALDDTANTLSTFFGSESPIEALEALEAQGNALMGGIEETLNDANKADTNASKRPEGAISDTVSSFFENTLDRLPDLTENSETAPSSAEELHTVSLIRIVDGDTLIVKDGDEEIRIRLIGIDTPESVNTAHPEKNNEWGKMASDHTKEILQDVSNVYLEYDQERTDPYARTLAYVWMANDTSDIANMLNYRILADGYCNTLFIEPNTKYQKTFEKCKNDAKESLTGLWAEDGFTALWE